MKGLKVGEGVPYRRTLRVWNIDAGNNNKYLAVSFDRFGKAMQPVYERKSLRKKQTLYFTPYAIAVLDSNGRLDRSAAAAAFGYSPRSLQNSVRDTVIWLKKTGRSLRFNLIGKQCLMGPTRRKNESPFSRTYCAAAHPSDCYSKCSLSICSYPLLTLPIQNKCLFRSILLSSVSDILT